MIVTIGFSMFIMIMLGRPGGLSAIAVMPPAVSVWSWRGLLPKAFGRSHATPAVNRLLPCRAAAAIPAAGYL